MGRESLLERHERLQRRQEEIAGRPAVSPSPIHAQMVRVMRQLLQLSMTHSTADTPTQFKVLLRMVDRLEPTIVENLATVPAATIREFMRMLGAEIQSIVDSPPDPSEIPGEVVSHANGDRAPAADHAGADLATPA